MGDFSDTRCYHQYIEACTRRKRAKQRVEDLKSCGLLFVEDEESYQQWKAEIAAAEAALKAASEEADRLYCLSTYGKSPEALYQENTYRPMGLQPKPHFPAPPDFTGRKLH